MSEDQAFEIEDEPRPESKPGSIPALKGGPQERSTPEPSPAREAARGSEVTRTTASETNGPLAALDDRRRKRLLRFVPALTIAFLLVGAVFVRGAFWIFAPAGAALGVFAAWRQRSEVLLGTLGAVAGIVSSLIAGGLISGVSSIVAMVSCGTIGYLAGLDDRLRGG